MGQWEDKSADRKSRLFSGLSLFKSKGIATAEEWASIIPTWRKTLITVSTQMYF